MAMAASRSQLGNGGLKLIHLGKKKFHSSGLPLVGLLVGKQPSVTSSLVLSLLGCLFHKPHNEILDHLLDLKARKV